MRISSDMRISSSGSINYCSLQIAETFSSSSETSAVVIIIPWKVNAKKRIIVAILLSFPKPMDVVISEQCQWDLLLQCLHLWETKYPTCGSLIQKSDVITTRLEFLDQPNKIFHSFHCCYF